MYIRLDRILIDKTADIADTGWVLSGHGAVLMKAVVKKRVLKKRSGRIVPGRSIFGCGLPDFVGGTFQGARRLNQAAQAGKAGRCGHEQHDAEKDEVEKYRGEVCLTADVGDEYAHADGQSCTEDRDGSSQIQDDSPFVKVLFRSVFKRRPQSGL